MKNKKILMIISIITLISFIIGFSYAYFTTIVIGNDTASSNITTSGSLRLTYNGTDYISLENSQPGSSDSMTFTVTNTGSLPLSNYEIYLSNLINTFTNDEVIYEIDCVSSDVVSCLGKTQTPLPIVETLSITQGSIAPGTTHTYTLTVSFIDTGSLQDYNQDKELYFTITINEQFTMSTIMATSYVYLGAPKYRYDTVGYFWDYKNSITSITFEDEIDIPVGAFASWDVSEDQDGSVMAYIIDDGLGKSTYELYIQTNSNVIMANTNSSYFFYNFGELTTINNLSILDTSFVTNMDSMFWNCWYLTSLDLSNFNTSKVTNMARLFSNLGSLTSIDLSSLDTSNVTNMFYMFGYLESITSLDLSNFNTSKVTDMSLIFEGCIGLTSIDLSPLDTRNVTTMYAMFNSCSGLLSIDLSPLDTSKVIDMQSMFYGCSSLTSLNITPLNTTNVTNMQYMFENCSGLTSLDLSTFDTSSVTNMNAMFLNCASLASLDVSSFDTGSVTNMSGIFYNCSSLTSLDLSTFDTGSVTYMSMMFYGCSSLTSLDVSTFDTSSVTTMYGMFYNCSSLTSLDVSTFDKLGSTGGP
ncbi:MAG: BspA family leucine-rich repeat surface protein, partial [Mollicutes bacterium]|nr:BspA family leucine-rich repeat surface protein [Mollicutes bacterium]